MENDSINQAPENNGQDIQWPILLLGLLLIFGFLAWTHFNNFDIAVASQGYSPVAYVYGYFESSNLLNDFPYAVANYDKSLFMHIYKVSYAHLDIKPELLAPYMIGVQIAFFGVAIYFISRTILSDSPKTVPVLITIVMIASNINGINFARYGYPGTLGLMLYYYIADGLRILSLVAFIKHRFMWSAILLALSFCTYPSFGIIGGLFIFACWLVDRKGASLIKLLLPAITFIIIATLWTVYSYKHSSLFNSGQIPFKAWVDLSLLSSAHMYPWDYGILTDRLYERFIPFLSLMILSSFYAIKLKPLKIIDRQMIAGIIAVTLLSLIGIFISAIKPNPTLIKLSLQRANDLAVILGVIYVFRGLWSEFQTDAVWRKVIAGTIIISPFILLAGFPLLFSLILVSPHLYSLIKDRQFSPLNITALALTASGLILFIVYLFTAPTDKSSMPSYVGNIELFQIAIILAVALYALDRVSMYAISIAVFIAFLSVAALWVGKQNMSLQEKHKFAADYKDVQLWANRDTPKNALFMVDPTIYYGWRDFSHRSSFGNLREWIHNSWTYNSQLEIYQEGMKRFNEYSIDLDRYLVVKPPIRAFKKLSSKVKEKYYKFGDKWRLRMSKKYGVDYFVLMKGLVLHPSKMKVAYQNRSFIVLQP